MVNAINNIQQTQPNVSAMQARAQPMQGAFGNTRIIKMPSISQIIQNMQEELGEARSEDEESKKVEDHKVEDFYDNHYVDIVKKIRESYPTDDEPQKLHIKKFLAYLHQKKPQHEKDIRQFLEELTPDKAEGFAILQEAIEQGDKEGLSETTQELLKTTAHNWIAQEGVAIQAGINTIEISRAMEKKLGNNAAELQNTYQTLVSSYDGILPALAQIADKQELDQLNNLSDFLMRSTAKDLDSIRPSAQPARLMRILAEFQGIKIFNTLHEWSGRIYDQFSAQLKSKTSLKKSELFTRALKFINHPENFNSNILTPLGGLDPSEKVLVLQGLRSGVRNLPNYLFPNGELAKSRILFPLQNEIDQLVFEQDA